MRAVIGLGNPGEEHEKTRHNAGRLALEYFAQKNDFSDWEFSKKYESLVSEGKIKKESALLLLPETFMNNSGKAVKNLSAKNTIILHDDIDLPLGKIKISYGRGSGGHKGVESVMRALKTKEFWRIRIGVSPKKKPEHKKIPDFLLTPIRKPDLETLKKSFKKISEALETMLSDSPEKAMNLYN
ncbi:MAG: aminoacyl-tRNA hydrolase [Candidatus Niyogibacteria bacterium]|nr:aminoacyl-tRNA hydrolase [Candidatus Niyogibacteria bacterium]